MTNPSVALVRVDPERAEAGDQRADAVAFFHPQLAGAADGDLAAVGGERGDGGQLVDQAGHFFRRDGNRLGAIAFDHDRPARLAVLVRGRLDVDPRAEAAQHAEERGARRVEADAFDLDARTRQRRGGDEPEGGGREVAGHDERLPV